MHHNSVATICEDPEEARHMAYHEHIYTNARYIDDVSGAELDSKLVQDARTEEIRGALKHNVYTKVLMNSAPKKRENPQ